MAQINLRLRSRCVNRTSRDARAEQQKNISSAEFTDRCLSFYEIVNFVGLSVSTTESALGHISSTYCLVRLNIV